ncbi:MAG: hypothetical protein PVG65_06975 [Candidatus Thorarchaeota archaeon]|jgi:hypothetical protein
MSQRHQMVLESMIFTAFLIVVDIILSFTISVVTQIPYSIFAVASLMIPEFGFMFVLGGCLMSRQPLKDEERYDQQGNMVRSWRFAILGKKVLLSAFFLFIFAGLFTFLGLLVIP